MSYEKLLAAGAEVINGHVFLNRELVGICSGADFILTPNGESFLESDTPPAAPKAPADAESKKPRAKAPKASTTDPTADLLGGLDDLTD